MELSRLIQHPEELNKETLYDLRSLLALYPYHQTARLLMLQNLYLLHDPSFDEELHRAAIYITDRKMIFQLVEAAHYQIKHEQATSHIRDDHNSDRTSSLINNFLESIPNEKEEEECKKKSGRKPTPADAAIDYVAYLMETQNCEEKEQTSRTITLIDDFIEDGGFKLKFNKEEDASAEEAEHTQEIEESNNVDEQTENCGIFTETLARIYIKQGKYERALQIIEKLNKQHPHKNSYFIDQMRFLEKLIINNKNK